MICCLSHGAIASALKVTFAVCNLYISCNLWSAAQIYQQHIARSLCDSWVSCSVTLCTVLLMKTTILQLLSPVWLETTPERPYPTTYDWSYWSETVEYRSFSKWGRRHHWQNWP